MDHVPRRRAGDRCCRAGCLLRSQRGRQRRRWGSDSNPDQRTRDGHHRVNGSRNCYDADSTTQADSDGDKRSRRYSHPRDGRGRAGGLLRRATAPHASTHAARAATAPAPPTPTPTVIGAVGGTATPGTVAGGGEDYCAELAGGSTDADVRVPAGETCTLDNARVGPNVILARDATLHARGSSIGGNVLSEGAAAVNL